MKINQNILREYDVRGIYPDGINELSAEALATAFALTLKIKKIAIGRDKREESKKIYPFIIKGLAKAGCQIYNMEEESTPSLHFAVGAKSLDGGIMVTASHNPPGFTGMKLFQKDGRSIGSKNGLDKIALLADKILATKTKAVSIKNKVKHLEILKEYYNFVFEIVDRKKIGNLKIVLDASGGSAAKIIEYFFIRIPGRTTKMNFRKDKYSDHGPNPMLQENRRPIEKEVRKQKAHLGIIWDGDGDRIIFIDEKGRFVLPYYANCLLSKIFLEKSKEIKLKNKKVVVDGRIQMAIKKVIESSGGVSVTSRSGYPNIVNAMKVERASFGCENSGHYFLNFLLSRKEKKNFTFGDGIMPALLVIEYLSNHNIKFSEAIAPFKKEYKISGEINVENKNFEKLSRKFIAKYKDLRIDLSDGISVFAPDFFLNIRRSVTEPLVRLNIEAVNSKLLEEVKKDALALIK